MISGAYADPACQFFSTRSVTKEKKSSSKLEIGRVPKLTTSCDFKISSKLLILKFAALSSSARRCTVALHSRDECQGSCIDLCAIGWKASAPELRQHTQVWERDESILHLFASIYIAILGYFAIVYHIYLHLSTSICSIWYSIQASWQSFWCLIPCINMSAQASWTGPDIIHDQSQKIMYPLVTATCRACTCWVGACEYFVQLFCLWS